MSIVVGPYDEDEVPDLQNRIEELETELAESERRNELLVEGMERAFERIEEQTSQITDLETALTKAILVEAEIRKALADEKAKRIKRNVFPEVGDPIYVSPKTDPWKVTSRPEISWGGNDKYITQRGDYDGYYERSMKSLEYSNYQDRTNHFTKEDLIEAIDKMEEFKR